jgi:hypothetical protein
MKVWGVVALVLMASFASAYSTGICFLDSILHGLDSLSLAIKYAVSPTTTTSSTSTSTTEPTTTTEPPFIYTTTTTASTSTTTTTTLFLGKCRRNEDCPATIIYKCNFNGNIDRISPVMFCNDPGEANSTCTGREVLRKDFAICGEGQKCANGVDHCID